MEGKTISKNSLQSFVVDLLLRAARLTLTEWQSEAPLLVWNLNSNVSRRLLASGSDSFSARDRLHEQKDMIILSALEVII